jgi:acetoin utilization deacetylase AcuC-like enzyme
LDGHKPELVVYDSGADIFAGDKLGGFNLSKEDLKERDAYAAAECFRRKIALAVVLGGGYSQNPEDTPQIHANTLETVANAFARM